MAVRSNGEYGITEGLMYGFPVVVDAEGNYTVVEGLEVNEQ